MTSAVRNLRRLAAHTFLALTLGASTTFAIAWYSAAARGHMLERTSEWLSPGPGWKVGQIPTPALGSVDRAESSTATRLRIVEPSDAIVCGTATAETEELRKVYDIVQPWDAVTPAWAMPRVRSVFATKTLAPKWSRSRIIEGHGWPARALFYEVDEDVCRTPAMKISFGMESQWCTAHLANAYQTAAQGYGVVLPTGPIWRGLVADTVVFSLPWILLMLITGPARRALRTHRSLCPRCAYPRAGLDPVSLCPECGSPS